MRIHTRKKKEQHHSAIQPQIEPNRFASPPFTVPKTNNNSESSLADIQAKLERSQNSRKFTDIPLESPEIQRKEAGKRDYYIGDLGLDNPIRATIQRQIIAQESPCYYTTNHLNPHLLPVQQKLESTSTNILKAIQKEDNGKKPLIQRKIIIGMDIDNGQEYSKGQRNQLINEINQFSQMANYGYQVDAEGTSILSNWIKDDKPRLYLHAGDLALHLQREGSQQTQQNLNKEHIFAHEIMQSKQVEQKIKTAYQLVKQWLTAKVKNEGQLEDNAKTNKFVYYYGGLTGHLFNRNIYNYLNDSLSDTRKMLTWIMDVGNAYKNKDTLFNGLDRDDQFLTGSRQDSGGVGSHAYQKPKETSPFATESRAQNAPLGAGISATTYITLKFLTDEVGISDKSIIDAVSYSLFGHWQTPEYQDKHGYGHTFHEVMAARKIITKRNKIDQETGYKNYRSIGEYYTENKLGQYPSRKLAKVFGLINGTDLQDRMKQLHKYGRASKQIQPISKHLDRYHRIRISQQIFNRYVINSEDQPIREKNIKEKMKTLFIRGEKLLKLINEQTDAYINAHQNSSVNQKRVDWLKNVFKLMISEEIKRVTHLYELFWRLKYAPTMPLKNNNRRWSR